MKQKNVVILMCDQLRKDCLGAYGNRYIQTPHVDALAQDGVRYERCYVNNPVCMPSRMSIFTGMYPRNHGLWANGVVLEDTKQTLMHHLVDCGWQTASIGKIHFEPTQDPTGAQSSEARCLWENREHTMQMPYWGFQYTQVTIGHGDVVGDYLKWFDDKGGTDDQRGIQLLGAATGISKTPKRLHYSQYIGEKACEYLTHKRNKEQPFFLCVSFPDPHLPFAPAAELGQARPIQKPIGDAEDLMGRPHPYQALYEQ
ncbi:MAG: sulfatase family protein, partial [Cellulosilyticaceae bacterium]